MEEGKKNDSEKARFDLLPTDSLEEVVLVLTRGAKKYGDRNWEKGIRWSRVFSALLRHVYAWWKGERRDTETGLSHMAHAICCCMFLLSYELRDMKLYDDRERLGLRDERAVKFSEADKSLING